MNKVLKIILSVMGGCNVILEMLTPLAVMIFWTSYFNYTDFWSIFFLCVGGLATMFRAIKIGLIR